MARGKTLIPRERDGEAVAFELPPYAVRYLASMCQRERIMIDNVAASGVYSPLVDAARDALNQIERALP